MGKAREAFSLIELIFVILLVGILAFMALPRIERDLRQEAIDNLVSAIRYTRHLAVMGVKSDAQHTTWQRTLWRFSIEGCSDEGIFYSIGTDLNRKGNISNQEAAKDPHSHLPMNGINSKPCEHEVQKNVAADIFLSKHYGILEKDIDWSDCRGRVKHIAFDHMGRLYRKMTHAKNDYRSYMKQMCSIHFTLPNDSKFTIHIESETGVVSVEGQPDT